MNLFDGEMTPDEALALLKATTMPAASVGALAVLIEDRERLKGVAGLAEAVRTAQKNYFRTRTDTALQTSKELERRLDQMLRN